MAHPPVPARRDGRHRPGLPQLARAQRRLHRHPGHRAVVRVQRPGLHRAGESRRRAPPGDLVAVELRGQRRRRRQAVDPRRPPVGLHVPGRLRRLDAHPPVLDLVHVGGPRLRPLLLLSELLRLLDAAARPGGQLPAAHRRLGVRGRGLLPAHLLLVPAAHRHLGRHQGVRHQRLRRCRPRARDVLHLQAHRHGRPPQDLPLGPHGLSQGPDAIWSWAVCSCSWGRSPSRPRCRCTRGCPTPWRARPRSRP